MLGLDVARYELTRLRASKARRDAIQCAVRPREGIPSLGQRDNRKQARANCGSTEFDV